MEECSILVKYYCELLAQKSILIKLTKEWYECTTKIPITRAVNKENDCHIGFWLY